jgi:hypothetical protein
MMRSGLRRNRKTGENRNYIGRRYFYKSNSQVKIYRICDYASSFIPDMYTRDHFFRNPLSISSDL